MGKYRAKTTAQVVDYTPRAKRAEADEVKLVFTSCCVCKKQIGEGYYGRWGDGGVCSKTCNEVMELKPKENQDDLHGV